MDTSRNWRSYALGAILGALVATGLFRIWQLQGQPNSPATTPAAVILAVPPNGRDQARGPADAPTTLLMYGDFSCAVCRAYWRAIARLAAEAPAAFRFVYRHSLVDRIQPNSRAAAIAAEAAGAQEKFWEYADLLYERQAEWLDAQRIEEIFERYASELGLDTTRFRRDFNDPSVRKKVNDDLRGARRSGVSGAPALFKNGAGLAPPKTYQELKRLVVGEDVQP